jgi:plasmid stabilization system protein ParE
VSFKLVVRPEVDVDLLVAEEWYEQQQSGLGQAFLRDVVAAVDRILLNPLVYRVRYGRKPVRWAYTNRFPYRIIFHIDDDTVVIDTIIHTARHHRVWKKRL